MLTFFLRVFVLPAVKVEELLSLFLLHLFVQRPPVDGLAVGSRFDLRSPGDLYPALLVFLLMLSFFPLSLRFLEKMIKAVWDTQMMIACR